MMPGEGQPQLPNQHGGEEKQRKREQHLGMTHAHSHLGHLHPSYSNQSQPGHPQSPETPQLQTFLYSYIPRHNSYPIYPHQIFPRNGGQPAQIQYQPFVALAFSDSTTSLTAFPYPQAF
jgi:hypothetical protein